jgi:hydroxymethylpyrimidine pyrophosphatase-like HAD family hydrolase
MKKFIINEQGNILFDTETQEISSIDSAREAISRIWVAEEPMTIVCDTKRAKYELAAKKGDIIIKFYDYDYPFPVVIAKSKDWVKNIDAFNKEMEKRRKETEKREDPAPCEGDCDMCCPA